MLISARKSFLFSFPGVLLYTVFVVFPIFFGFYLSLTDISSFVQKLHFVGAENYTTILADERFLNSFRVTVIFVVISSVVINLAALLIAIGIDASANRFVNGVTRVLVYLPGILTPIIIGFIWYYIYKLGIPAIFSLLGLKSLASIQFLSPSMALFSVTMATSWMNIGVAMLIYSAALLGVDSNLLAAASIDGAGGWRRLVSIKLPLITHAFIINFVHTLVFAFKQFDQIFSMTKGGPGSVTETLSIYIYRVAFKNSQVGRASAAAYVLFFVVMLVSLFIIVSLNKRAVER
jgi:ABC-type sugar transport system permease subunit